jgi:hypothetical protein
MEPCLLLGLIVSRLYFCGLWHWHLGVPRTRLPGDHRASPSRHLLMYLFLYYTLPVSITSGKELEQRGISA